MMTETPLTVKAAGQTAKTQYLAGFVHLTLMCSKNVNHNVRMALLLGTKLVMKGQFKEDAIQHAQEFYQVGPAQEAQALQPQSAHPFAEMDC